MIKHYARLFSYLGGNDNTHVLVDHRDPHKVLLSEEFYGFEFFDREETEGETGILRGEIHNVSPSHYVGQEVRMSEAEAELSSGVFEDPHEQALADEQSYQMLVQLRDALRYHKSSRVVKLRGGFKDGQFLPLTLDCIVLSENQRVQSEEHSVSQ